MNKTFLVNTSTAAQKAKRFFLGRGIPVEIKKITSKEKGCRYALSVPAEYLYAATAELERQGLPFTLLP